MDPRSKRTKDDLVPSDELVHYVGGGDFKAIGDEFLSYFIKLGMLLPSDSVLDIGCGSGRMAVPLTKYLNEHGSYEGFDIYAKGIKWSQENITSQYQNFKFQLVDIYNHLYNPQGKYNASEYKFPYKDNSFDFIFLTSVFTHLLPLDLENYLSEATRVLKETGKCFITFFLLNPESINLMQSPQCSIKFAYDKGEYFIHNESHPEAAVAYKETFIKELIEKYGLEINGVVHYGSWCGRGNFLSYQDIIVLKNKGF